MVAPGAANGGADHAQHADDAAQLEVALLTALQSSLATSDLPPVDVELQGDYPDTEIVLRAHGREERHAVWRFDPAAPDDPSSLDVQFALYRLATTAAWLADSPPPSD